MATADPATSPVDAAAHAEQPLPKLSPADFRAFNRLSETMNYYHNHFRQQWRTLHDACTASKRPSGMSIRQFLNLGLEFCSSIRLHHGIEERHIFPVLATRMPAFRQELELLTQHKQIHAGMDGMEAYMEACRAGEKDFRFEELRAVMDAFGTVLWQHLDDEVRQLGAENMRRYWKKDELRMIPM